MAFSGTILDQDESSELLCDTGRWADATEKAINNTYSVFDLFREKYGQVRAPRRQSIVIISRAMGISTFCQNAGRHISLFQSGEIVWGQ